MTPLTVAVPSVALAGGALWIAKALIQRSVEKAVDATFERRIENLRSDLRVKEGQISALQTSALNNRAGRDAIIERRRIEAVENLWKTLIALRRFKQAVIVFNILDMDAVGKRAPTESNLRDVIGMVAGLDQNDIKELAGIGGDIERLFVPVDAWDTFIAFRSILLYASARLTAIRNGLEESEKLIGGEGVLNVVKLALPSYEGFIDRFGISGIGKLIEPLEELLFAQLQAALKGEEADAQAVERSAHLLRRASHFQDEVAQMAAVKN